MITWISPFSKVTVVIVSICKASSPKPKQLVYETDENNKNPSNNPIIIFFIDYTPFTLFFNVSTDGALLNTTSNNSPLL